MLNPKNSKPEGIMDEKEIGLSIVKWLSQNTHAVYAGLIAAVISFLRIVYDYSTGQQHRTWLSTFAESMLCGAITLSISSSLNMFGLPETAATMVGGGIGFFGVEKLRKLADSWLGAKNPWQKNDSGRPIE